LGVDLGTTYSAAAVATEGNSEIIPLSHRAPQIRSAAYRAPDGQVYYGDVAARHLVLEPDRTTTEFKRRIGDATNIYLGGTPMSALALSKGLLTWVVEAVTRGQGEPPGSLTVACPASWGPHRRELMDQVINLSPDYPSFLCTEPEAAGAHYATSGRMQIGEILAVYDLGGGTFDAAILQRTKHGFITLGSPSGDELLGGFELDAAVLHHALETAGLKNLDLDDDAALEALARLRADCTDAREALSTELEVSIPLAIGTRRTSVRLTRHEFESLVRDRVEESVGTLERVIAGANLKPTDLSAVLLVGGTARTPLVSEMVSTRLKTPVVLDPQPKLCVALGAALIGAQRQATMAAARTRSPRRPAARAAASALKPELARGWTGLVSAKRSAAGLRPRLAGAVRSAASALKLALSRGPTRLTRVKRPAPRLLALVGAVLALLLMAGVVIALARADFPGPAAGKPGSPATSVPAVPSPTPSATETSSPYSAGKPAQLRAIAHGGGGEKFAQNTLQALLDGANTGAAVELDVRRTSDGVAILANRPELPTADEAYTRSALICKDKARVIGSSKWSTIRKYCHSWAEASGGKEYPIITFEQAMKKLAPLPGVQVFAENKEVKQTRAQDLEFLRTITRHGMAARTIITSYDRASLGRMAQLATEQGLKIERMLLVNTKELPAVSDLKRDGLWGVMVRSDLVTKRYFSAVNAAGLKAVAQERLVTPGKSNDLKESERIWEDMENAGALVTITDRPRAYVRWRG
jgi:glycerophosphoryl diester phosphodiesterase